MVTATAKKSFPAPETGHAFLALNAGAQGGELIAALCFELPAPAESGTAPRTITLIPAPGADGFARGIDGRAWKLGKAEQIVAAFNRRRAITENHAGRLAAPNGGSAPAFGWIEQIRTEGGAIVADIEWTPRGIAALNNREYRYFSPEFVWDEKTREIEFVVGGALTNDPNFPQLALNRECHQEPHPMNLTAIAKALGLVESADEASCLTAITTLKTERQTALNQAQTPDLTKFAPREELATALNRATTAEGELKTIKAAAADAEIIRLVDEAQAAGKIIPATREQYTALCRADVEQFKKLAAVMPVISAPSETDKKPGGTGAGAEGLTANQLAICQQQGLDPKAYAESLKASA